MSKEPLSRDSIDSAFSIQWSITGLVPVFYHQDIEVAKKVAKACADGGSRLLEFTNRGDLAIEVFAQLEKYCRSELKTLILGVGSVVDAPTAVQYINSGASLSILHS